MKKKCDAVVTAKIKARRAQGAQIADISREFGLGYATIHRALGAKGDPPAAVETPKPTCKPATDTRPSAGDDPLEPLPTVEDLRRSLASQVKDLRVEIEGAETPSARAAMNRLLVATQQLLTRITPPADTATGMMMIPRSEMENASAKGQARFLRLISAAIENQNQWPVCPACKRAVAPADLGDLGRQ